MGLGKSTSNYPARYVIETGIEAGDFELPQTSGSFARVDTPGAMDNQAMFWGMPTIQAFHSIVPGSVMEFYNSLGVSRSVASRPDTSHYALRSFLSVRWLFDYTNEDDLLNKDEDEFFMQDGETVMPGWSYFGEQNGFAIYENQCYIPMGFSYDYYLTRSEYEELPRSRREKVLLKALIVEDENESHVSNMMSRLPVDATSFSEQTYFKDCQTRRYQSVSSFDVTDDGFTATWTSDRSNVVFFSVPYEEGWSATVNGEPVEILKAGIGFMAVRCPAGNDVSIRFTYATPGLALGAKISAGAMAALAVYVAGFALWERHKRRRRTALPRH